VELKSYLNILLRRWPIVVGLPIIVALLAIVQLVNHDPVYTTDVKARVIYEDNQPPTDDYQYGGYYTFSASEYNIDDLVEVLRGNVFSTAVANRIDQGSYQLSVDDIKQAVTTDRTHRILTVSVSTTNANRSVAIANAIADELEQSASDYLGLKQIGSQALIDIVDRPNNARDDATKTRLLMALEVVAALGAGVLIAFFVDYLDDTLYDGETTAAALHVPHLASVPAENGG
jgi:capsular polysaccharide biosynthesis protein